MNYDLNEIVPQDSYIVKLVKSISYPQFSYLIDLYQPIISIKVMGFYFTLLNELPLGTNGVSQIRIHRELMSQMYISFKEIINARKVLEAVGLLKSVRYKHQDTGELVIEYTLISPLEPKQYFQSDILSLMLLNRVGKSQFQKLRKKHLDDLEWNNGSYLQDKNITKSFDEVFDSILTSELKITPGSELEQLLQPDNSANGKEIEDYSLIKHKYIDIEFIKGMISENYQLNKSLDDKLEALLQELAFLYQLTETDIIAILKDQTVYDKFGKIDKEMLRNRISEKYQYSQKEVLLVNRDDLVELELNNNQIEEVAVRGSKAKKHRLMLESYSPLQLMKEYQGGGKIPAADLKIIEALTGDYKLPFEVVNVLIEYVMLTNELKLPKNLTEKIAGHWKRLKITTVEQAQIVAKKEHQLYKSWKENTKGKTKTASEKKRVGTSQSKKQDIPDYILKQDERYPKRQGNTADGTIDLNKKAIIDGLLKDLGEV